VARVGADHAHHTLAANDAAVLADATNGTTYFHVCFTLFLEWSNELIVYHIEPSTHKGVIKKKILFKKSIKNTSF
jgi:hypothetical protein